MWRIALTSHTATAETTTGSHKLPKGIIFSSLWVRPEILYQSVSRPAPLLQSTPMSQPVPLPRPAPVPPAPEPASEVEVSVLVPVLDEAESVRELASRVAAVL